MVKTNDKHKYVVVLVVVAAAVLIVIVLVVCVANKTELLWVLLLFLLSLFLFAVFFWPLISLTLLFQLFAAAELCLLLMSFV